MVGADADFWLIASEELMGGDWLVVAVLFWDDIMALDMACCCC